MYKFNIHIPQKYNMTPKETLAYQCCIIYEHCANMIFPNYRHARLKKTGDPRKCSLFKHCYKMVEFLDGKLEKKFYPYFIKSQFDIFNKIYQVTGTCPLITPNIISSLKSVNRWKVWKYYNDKIKHIKVENNTVVSSQQLIELEFSKTLDFMNVNSEIFKDIQSFIDNSKNILKFCILKKISPYYIALSPWVEKLELKEEIYKISNSETILEILSETDKKLHRKYFNKEYNSKLN